VRTDLRFGATPKEGGGTIVRAEAKLHLSGRAAQFGRSMVGDVSKQLFQEFGRCVDRTLTTGEVAAPVRMSGGKLALQALRGRLLARWEAIRNRRRKG
jgi:carbon-monoxide dehydrogenase small subunit